MSACQCLPDLPDVRHHPEFLPQHREQRQQLLQIVSAAEVRGQARVAEMNRQVLGNLEKIITGLEDDPGQPEAAADAS
jgi:hypothetical protein